MFTEIITLAITLITNAATISEPEPITEPVPIVEEVPATVEDTNGYIITFPEEDGMESAIHIVGVHYYEWEVTGDTRTLKCLHCGDQKITEYCYNGVWGYYDELSAATLWSYVNTTRGNTQYCVMEQGFCIGIATVDALIEDEALMEKARFRATEAAVNFSHGENADECLAWGLGTPEMAMDSWLLSYSHCYAITNPDYIYGGIACFWFDSDNSGENLTPIWVLELGY